MRVYNSVSGTIQEIGLTQPSAAVRLRRPTRHVKLAYFGRLFSANKF